jgi:hypothetical protein
MPTPKSLPREVFSLILTHTITNTISSSALHYLRVRYCIHFGAHGTLPVHGNLRNPLRDLLLVSKAVHAEVRRLTATLYSREFRTPINWCFHTTTAEREDLRDRFRHISWADYADVSWYHDEDGRMVTVGGTSGLHGFGRP